MNLWWSKSTGNTDIKIVCINVKIFSCLPLFSTCVIFKRKSSAPGSSLLLTSDALSSGLFYKEANLHVKVIPCSMTLLIENDIKKKGNTVNTKSMTLEYRYIFPLRSLLT